MSEIEDELMGIFRKHQERIERREQESAPAEAQEESIDDAFERLRRAVENKRRAVRAEREASQKAQLGPMEWAERVLKVKRYHPKHDAMCIEVHRIAMDWFNRRGPRCVVLCGESGVGKTMVMRNLYAWCGAVKITAWQRGGWPGNPPQSWMVYWPDVVASYQDQGKWDDLLPSLAEPSILFMDDVGRESDRFKSGDNKRILLSVLSHRQYKWTVVSTNKHPSKFPEDWDFATEDRIYRNGGQVVNLFGVDSFNLLEGE